jgi:hypothetical protein
VEALDDAAGEAGRALAEAAARAATAPAAAARFFFLVDEIIVQPVDRVGHPGQEVLVRPRCARIMPRPSAPARRSVDVAAEVGGAARPREPGIAAGDEQVGHRLLREAGGIFAGAHVERVEDRRIAVAQRI